LFRRVAVCLTLVASMGVAASADARVFYVSPAGRNWRSGRSPGAAWRTVGRVNRARLRPGDVVEFRAGRIFSDAQLTPQHSGTSAAPIRFTSYGSGRATLTQGVWFASIAWIAIEGLRLQGAANGIASGHGSGSRHVAILHNVISDVGVAVNATNPSDYAWTIASNRISHTGDSGVITLGDSADIWGNEIVTTGTDLAIPWDKHGIYSKGPRAHIVDNRIAGFSAQGISTRFRDAFISGNLIAGGDAGIGYWQQDPLAGTTVICGNTIARVRYGVLIGPESGAARERFRILDNHIATTGGPGVYVPSGHPALSAFRNIVSHTGAATVKLARSVACDRQQATASGLRVPASVRRALGSIMAIVIAGTRVANMFGTQGANRVAQAG
jgi:Right handed beta helix region